MGCKGTIGICTATYIAAVLRECPSPHVRSMHTYILTYTHQLPSAQTLHLNPLNQTRPTNMKYMRETRGLAFKVI